MSEVIVSLEKYKNRLEEKKCNEFMEEDNYEAIDMLRYLFKQERIKEKYNGKDTHIYIEELETKVDNLESELEEYKCMSKKYEDLNKILLKRLNKTYPKYAVKFFIANMICLFTAIFIFIFSIFSSIINVNFWVLLFLIMCNLGLMITSVASISDWRKTNEKISNKR